MSSYYPARTYVNKMQVITHTTQDLRNCREADASLIDQIIELIPHRDPFRFIDRIVHVDENSIRGEYRFDKTNPVFAGHFPGFPVTPGVLLVEVMAQTGLLAFALYLLSSTTSIEEVAANAVPVLASADVHFHKQSTPGELLTIISEKILFRHKKIICSTSVLNEKNELICSGVLTGFIFPKSQH
jgi:3-hydroxyacyl-[acyl-carrier-protein] dehydratase